MRGIWGDLPSRPSRERGSECSCSRRPPCSGNWWRLGTVQSMSGIDFPRSVLGPVWRTMGFGLNFHGSHIDDDRRVGQGENHSDERAHGRFFPAAGLRHGDPVSAWADQLRVDSRLAFAFALAEPGPDAGSARAAGKPARAAVRHPRGGHERQGLDGHDDQLGVDGRRVSRRSLHVASPEAIGGTVRRGRTASHGSRTGRIDERRLSGHYGLGRRRGPVGSGCRSTHVFRGHNRHGFLALSPPRGGRRRRGSGVGRETRFDQRLPSRCCR